jgi:tetratricopeptide (TPR) repeat protein
MKTTIQGYIQFANQRSFEKALQAFQNRATVYYKQEFLFKTPEFFDDEHFRFVVPKTIIELSEKFWRNTVDAVEFLAQFAVHGKVEAYRLDNGKIVQKVVIEPVNDKKISQDFHQAVQIINTKTGDLSAAKSLLMAVLETEPKHQQAAEHLGWILLKEKNYPSAIAVLQKAALPGIPSARSHYLKGIAYSKQSEPEKALADFDHAVKCSMGIQDIHWKARLYKAKTLVELDITDNAEKELSYYLERTFEKDSKNELARKAAYFLMGQIRFNQSEFQQSLDFFDKAIAYSHDEPAVSSAKCYYYRGLVRQKLGAAAFAEDFELAKSMGFELSASH